MKHLLCCALLLTAFSACRPKLRVNQDFDIPQDKALVSSLDVENALQSSYAYLRSKHCYGGSWMIWPEIMSDNVVYNPGTSYSTPELNIYNRNLLPSDTMIGQSWSTAYKAIGISNAVIDAIAKGKIQDSDFEANKNRFLGEAHFIRAITLFELVRFFAPQYSEASKGMEAIPLPLENYSSVTYLPRKTVEEVYAQIISDLQVSSSYFKNGGLISYSVDAIVPIGSGFQIFNRPNYHISIAMLSRVLMQKGGAENLEEAIRLITEILEDRSKERFDVATIESSSLNYPMPYPLFGTYFAVTGVGFKDMFVNNSAKGVSFTNSDLKQHEFLFSIMNFRNDDPATNTSAYFVSRYSYNRLQPDFYNIPCPYVPIFNPSINLFEFGLDRRYRAFFPNSAGNTTVTLAGARRPVCNKYNGEIVNIPVIRSADLLLSRAEARVRLGRTKEALFDLFFVKLRGNRATQEIVDNYYLGESTGVMDKDSLLEQVVKERRREMYLEGDRLHTLRRLNIDIPPAERGPGLPWNSEQLIFPIPFVETNVNTKLN